MEYSICISKIAEWEIKKIYRKILYEYNDEQAAEKFISEVDETIMSLSQFPYRRRLIDDTYLSQRNVRFISIRNYVAIFVIDEQEKVVNIVRFLSTRSDWISILKSNDHYLVSEKVVETY